MMYEPKREIPEQKATRVMMARKVTKVTRETREIRAYKEYRDVLYGLPSGRPA